jgi:high affinity sulfate transporter 1
MLKPIESSRLQAIAPGLPALLRYRFAQDFPSDLVAGISVAAVAVPVAIAYAQLAGFNPVVGLYSSILPLVVYAVFGTSRQLMVNPDAAACAMIASAVAPLAAGNGDLYLSLTITLTFFTGLICIAASFFRLGALADFLSKPILVGFLNGVALSIFLGQIGKLFGFPITSGRILPRVFEFVSKLPQTHYPTLAVSVGSVAVLLIAQRFLPRLPTALVVMVVAGAAAALLGLDQYGVALLGVIPPGLPQLRFPHVPLDDLPALLAQAGGLALVLFTSGTLTARSFAARGGYKIDVDREFAAYGAANVASALSQGFAVTGADSRTAMAVTAGGRTQVTGIVAAATIAILLLFFTQPLKYVPIPALGTVLIFAAFSLFDMHTLREIWRIDRSEVVLAVITMLAVVAVGAINGILVAVALALARFVRQSARPRDEILGSVEGMAGFHSIDRHENARTYPGLVIFRFNAPITFFNADYFVQRALAAAEGAGPGLRWFVIDAIPISNIDISGLYALNDLRHTFEKRGITLVYAGRRTEIRTWLQEIGVARPEYDALFFPSLRQALKAFLSQTSEAEAPFPPDNA